MAIIRPKSKQQQQRQGWLLVGLVVIMGALQAFAGVNWTAVALDIIAGG